MNQGYEPCMTPIAAPDESIYNETGGGHMA